MSETSKRPLPDVAYAQQLLNTRGPRDAPVERSFALSSPSLLTFEWALEVRTNGASRIPRWDSDLVLVPRTCVIDGGKS
ncbi:MAG: hypothetical protein QOH29_2635 [Actinomycetota bacterium]|nr:hypothetical protein [Actinomycetota bacterium]